MQGSTNRRIGLNFKAKAGIHGRLNRSYFLKEETRIHRPLNRFKFLKEDVGIHESVNLQKGEVLSVFINTDLFSRFNDRHDD